MDNRPLIASAIPQARYQIGAYSATLLAEITSRDCYAYRYILAFVAPGQTQPTLYLCAIPSGHADQPHCHDLRVISEALNDVLDQHERWADRDLFVEQALDLGCQMLSLPRESATKLM